MKTRPCLALVLTSVLALGCASANAQDDQGGGQPPAPKADPGKRRPPPGFDAEQAKKAMTEHIAAIEKRMAELQKSGVLENDRQITELTRAADELRERIAELERGVRPDFAGGGRPGPGHDERIKEADDRIRDAERRAADAKEAVGKLQADGVGPDHPQMQEATARLKEAVAVLERSRAEMEAADRDGHVFVGHAGMGRDPGARRAWSEKRGPQGPGPSVEERLAQLERAVREMHEMFARHDVPPEMRERAEREMRERRGDRPPMGERVVVLPLAPDGPRRAPVPIAPRGPEAAGTFKIEMQRDVAEELKRFAAAQQEQVAAQQEQVASLQKQLADTQAQLKKAMDELEALKAKQTTK